MIDLTMTEENAFPIDERLCARTRRVRRDGAVASTMLRPDCAQRMRPPGRTA
jgi:hypothetical protein